MTLIDFLSSLAPTGDQPRASSAGTASVSIPVRKSKYGQKDTPGETNFFFGKVTWGSFIQWGGGGVQISNGIAHCN